MYNTDTIIAPAYSIPGFEFFRADCMDIMRQYPDKYFDLAIVDPPYGLPKDAVHGRGKLKTRAINSMDTTWDIAPNVEYFSELWRVSKNQIIWGGNYFNLPPCRDFICWDKVQPWENFSQVEFAWTSFDNPSKLFRYDNRTGDKIHPTQKPVSLYDWILSKYANHGDRIIDTHLGSNSIGIAIDKANTLDNKDLTFVGVELDQDYFDAGIKRFKNYKLQGVLSYTF